MHFKLLNHVLNSQCTDCGAQSWRNINNLHGIIIWDGGRQSTNVNLVIMIFSHVTFRAVAVKCVFYTDLVLR
jgi:hypothetical protein